MRKQKEYIVPHVVKTMVTSNGVTVHIADNYCRNLTPEERERRVREVQKVAWRIIHNCADAGIYLCSNRMRIGVYPAEMTVLLAAPAAPKTKRLNPVCGSGVCFDYDVRRSLAQSAITEAISSAEMQYTAPSLPLLRRASSTALRS